MVFYPTAGRDCSVCGGCSALTCGGAPFRLPAGGGGGRGGGGHRCEQGVLASFPALKQLLAQQVADREERRRSWLAKVEKIRRREADSMAKARHIFDILGERPAQPASC